MFPLHMDVFVYLATVIREYSSQQQRSSRNWEKLQDKNEQAIKNKHSWGNLMQFCLLAVSSVKVGSLKKYVWHRQRKSILLLFLGPQWLHTSSTMESSIASWLAQFRKFTLIITVYRCGVKYYKMSIYLWHLTVTNLKPNQGLCRN